MKNITRHTGKLRIIKREKSSYNGNPRYCLTIDDIACYTAPDAMLAYEVPNFDGKCVEATIGMHYGRATVSTIKEAREFVYNNC